MLEVGQGLLEEGDETGLRRGVELLLQPRGEHLRLHPALNKTLTMFIILKLIRGDETLVHLYKLSNILCHSVGLVAG